MKKIILGFGMFALTLILVSCGILDMGTRTTIYVHQQDTVKKTVVSDAIDFKFPLPIEVEGQVFVGWFYDKDGEGDEVTYASLRLNTSKEIDIHAVWRDSLFNITFNQGEVVSKLNTDNLNEFDFPKLIEVENKSFVGWYYNKIGEGERVTLDTLEKRAGNKIEIFAVWSDQIVNIKFYTDREEDKEIYLDKNYFYNDVVELPMDLTKEGYELVGWVDINYKEFNGKTLPEKDLELYPDWKPIVYKIFYSLDGGVNSEDNLKEYDIITAQTQKKFELKDPYRENYTFLGWYNKEGVKLDEINLQSLENITLTARWELSEMNVTLIRVGAREVESAEVVDLSTTNGVYVLKDEIRTGYKFLGWKESESGEVYKYLTKENYKEGLTLKTYWNIEFNYVILEEAHPEPLIENISRVQVIKSEGTTLIELPEMVDHLGLYIFRGWENESGEIVRTIRWNDYKEGEIYKEVWIADYYTLTIDSGVNYKKEYVFRFRTGTKVDIFELVGEPQFEPGYVFMGYSKIEVIMTEDTKVWTNFKPNSGGTIRPPFDLEKLIQ